MPYQQHICQHCGKEFKVMIAPSTPSTGGRFCSYACHASSRRGAANSNWRGGRIAEPSGRVRIYALGHPDARQLGGSHIYEYRLVAEKKIGRPLTADEVVHHVNGDVTDNRPENLEVMTPAEHCRVHMQGSKNYNSKLNEVQVAEIRRSLQFQTPQITLASQYGVSPTAISRIARGRTWRHVQ